MLNIEDPNLGEKIRRSRLRSGLSQTALAVKAGMSGGYLSSIETGAARPSPEKMMDIRKALNDSSEEDEFDNESLETLIAKIKAKGFAVTISTT